MSERTRAQALADPNNFVEIESCELCGSKERSVDFVEEPFSVVRCSNCDLVYVTPRLKPDVLPEVYNEEYWSSDSPKERGYADYRKDAELYLKTFRKRYKVIEPHLPSPGRALDIGCAAGFFLKVLSENGWQVEGVELSKDIAAHAKEQFGFEQVFVGYLEDTSYADKSFDLITMWDVVEHVPEPLPFLEKAVSLLKDDGVLVLETQNVASKFAKKLGPKWHHYKHLEHLYHFDPKTIAMLLDQAGLEILHNTPQGGGKHVSVAFIRERATRVSKAMRYLMLPLAPLDRMSLYVNVKDEMIVVARKRKGD